MFKIGDKVLVKVVWTMARKDDPGLISAKSIDGMVGEIDGLDKRYPVTFENGVKGYCSGYIVVLMNGESKVVNGRHLIKIDDDDATPDTKSEWRVNDIWTPFKNINKKLLTT